MITNILDIDTRVQGINIEKTYVTSMLARGGLLWVGTDNGVIITYPLPRLGGVPQVSGKPCVSFHGHEGAVRCLHAFRVERSLRNCKLDNIAGILHLFHERKLVASVFSSFFSVILLYFGRLQQHECNYLQQIQA